MLNSLRHQRRLRLRQLRLRIEQEEQCDRAEVISLLVGIDIRYAIGASLVSVIATSSGAAAAYVREGYSNVRIAMLLEVATTLGALRYKRLAWCL